MTYCENVSNYSTLIPVEPEIWVRGGKDNVTLQSILGHKLASKITVTDKIR